jgi:hypothetical protein
MVETNWFRINSPSVIFETMDNEVIIINLDQGYYYSLNGLGADIWKMINQDLAQETISTAISSHFLQSLANVSLCIQPFFDKLLKENLIKAQNRPENADLDSAHVFHSKSTYEPIALQKYDDMKNLLFLDPIHEVDELGWPSQNVFEANQS